MMSKLFGARFFFLSFCRKSSISLILLCFLFGTLSVFAADDVEQTAALSVRETVKQAKKLAKKGDLEGAEKMLRPVAAADQKSNDAKIYLAYVLLKQKKLVEAFTFALPVTQAEPRNAYAFAVLSAIYLNAGNFTEASNAVTTSLKLDNHIALAWAEYGLLNFYENRISKSLDSLNTAVYYDPGEPDFIFAYAQVAARAERYREASDAYQKFLDSSNELNTERRERIEGLVRFLRYLGGRTALYALDGADKTSINFKLVGNRPLIEVKINNSAEPLRFVLDTGSSISVISDEAAEKLKIKTVTHGGFAHGIGGDGKFEIVYGFLHSVDVGGVRVKNVPVYIRKFHSSADKVDGYIGLALISKFLTTVDYGDLTFSLARKKNENGAKTPVEDVSEPLRLTSSGFLSGEVQIQGIEVPFNFIVDTGASVSVISSDLAGMKQFNEMVTGEKMSVIGSAGITSDVSAFLIPRVSFGKNSREGITAISLDLDVINETSGFTQSGILGGNFLKNYRMTFDFENSKVTFVPIVQRK